MHKLPLFLVLSVFASDHALAQAPDFKKDIVPLLESSCVKCHNPEKKKGKLDMTTKEAFVKGGSNGKVVEPGKPDDSAMIKALLLPADADEAMPPEGKAPRPTAAQIDTLKKWIAAGANWPDGVALTAKEEAQ
jgi:Planctomycete cytochrome C